MNRKIILGVFILIFASAFWRVNAFWSQHWKGDQSQYAVLAMKLSQGGLRDYNLREVRLGLGNYEENGVNAQMIFFKPHDPGQVGDLLYGLKLVGQGYYDEPLHMRAPLFPYILSWSHWIFARGKTFELFSSPTPAEVIEKKPWKVFRAQFWAAWVPVFFNISLIFITFIMGSHFFNYRVGFVAALLLATNPVSLFVCHRLLTEDTTVFFITLSLFLFWIFFSKNNWLGLFFAGAVGGLAVLTRQTAGFLVFVAWGYLIVVQGRAQWTWRGWFKSLFHPAMFFFMAGLFTASGFWFLKVYQVYGNPLHVPYGEMQAVLKNDTTGWFRTLGFKPPPVLFFSFGTFALCPLFGMALATLTDYNRRAKALWVLDPTAYPKKDPVVFLWLWVIAFFLWASQPWQLLQTAYLQESRYFYPAYPAIAVLAAWGIEKARARFKQGGHRWADIAISTALFVNAVYAFKKFSPFLTANLMMM